MSYSFSVRAATAAAALAAATAKLDEQIATQPVHALDRDQALAAAKAFVDLLPADDTRDVSIMLSGSVSGRWGGAVIESLTSANVSVTAWLTDRSQA